jgi:hypothetical protein
MGDSTASTEFPYLETWQSLRKIGYFIVLLFVVSNLILLFLGTKEESKKFLSSKIPRILYILVLITFSYPIGITWASFAPAVFSVFGNIQKDIDNSFLYIYFFVATSLITLNLGFIIPLLFFVLVEFLVEKDQSTRALLKKIFLSVALVVPVSIVLILLITMLPAFLARLL